MPASKAISKAKAPARSQSRARARRKRTPTWNAGGGKCLRIETSPRASVAEKCRVLAEIALHPITIYLDDDGSVDLLRARRRIPEVCLKKFDVHETTREDADGTEVTHRTINILFRDRVAALRLHEFLAPKPLARQTAAIRDSKRKKTKAKRNRSVDN